MYILRFANIIYFDLKYILEHTDSYFAAPKSFICPTSRQ